MLAAMGYVAAFLTTVSFVPDAVKVVRTKDVSGINPLMYSLFVAGVALWCIYGLATGQASLVIANAITFAFSSVTLFYKLKLDVFAKRR